MRQTILAGLGAGLISAVTFASAATGTPLVQFVLFLLTPLPVYLAGLGTGWFAAVVAGLSGGIALAIFTHPTAGLIFAATQLAPAGLLTYLAQLARPVPAPAAQSGSPRQTHDQGGGLEWYPVGRLIVWSAVIAVILTTAMLLLLGQDVEALRQSLREFIQKVIEQGMPEQGSGISPVSDADLTTITDISLRLLPAITAISLMGALLFNLWMAGRITLAAGRLRRPWPDVTIFTYPAGTPLLLAGTVLVASYATGMSSLFAAAAGGVIYFAYVLLGLAILHNITRGNPWRPLILWSIYLGLLILNTGLTLVLVVMALVEPFSPIRRNFLRPPGPGPGPNGPSV